MSGLFRYLGRAFGFAKPTPSSSGPFKNAISRDLTHFIEGDRVLIDGSKLTFLARNANFAFSTGVIQLNDIIGKPVGSTYVRNSKGKLHKVEVPSLEDYVTQTPRLVTPVYSSYASTIVSLLDLHPEPYDEHQNAKVASPQLHILEAGTGHGSLTLHIARAIAAANPPPPTAEIPKTRTYSDHPSVAINNAGTESAATPDDLTRAWATWKDSRRAILHTIEVMPSYSAHAEKLVRGFRRGLYWPHIDFHTGEVQRWLAQKIGNDNVLNSKAFFDHVLLDMPGVHEQLRHVAPAMRDDAKLVVFVPSVTQIGDCIRAISNENLPFDLIKVLELGEGISSGRKWDVRLVKPRKESASQKPGGNSKDGDESVGPIESSEELSTSPEADTRIDLANEELHSDESERLDTSSSQGPVMICRPMVGERTFGGGFIALFKKTSPEATALAHEWRKSQTGRARKRHR